MDEHTQEIPLNEWQIETITQPALVMNEQGKVEMGERQVKRRFIHVPLIPHRVCAPDNHQYQFVDGGKRQNGMVLVKCRNCSVGKQFVPGVHRLQDGKLLPFR